LSLDPVQEIQDDLVGSIVAGQDKRCAIKDLVLILPVHKILDDLVVSISAGQDERCSAVGLSGHQLRHLLLRPMVQKYLEKRWKKIRKKTEFRGALDFQMTTSQLVK